MRKVCICPLKSLEDAMSEQVFRIFAQFHSVVYLLVLLYSLNVTNAPVYVLNGAMMLLFTNEAQLNGHEKLNTKNNTSIKF